MMELAVWLTFVFEGLCIITRINFEATKENEIVVLWEKKNIETGHDIQTHVAKLTSLFKFGHQVDVWTKTVVAWIVAL